MNVQNEDTETFLIQAKSLIGKINGIRVQVGMAPLSQSYMVDLAFPCRVHDNETQTTEAGTARDIVWWLKGMKRQAELSLDFLEGDNGLLLEKDAKHMLSRLRDHTERCELWNGGI